MAKGVKIEVNGRGIEALLKSNEVRADLTTRAAAVLSRAQSTAPVESGAYRDGLRVIQDTTDRAVVRVGSDVAHSWVVEANTGNLARALDAGR